MRIVGEIEGYPCKITIFEMHGKYALKLESGLYEQTFKVRTGGNIENVNDVKKIVDATFVHNVLERFKTMHNDITNSYYRNIETQEEDEFDSII